ncbi:uncharacterized protein LOC132560871 [Ylistrum balloti]|uniref:uncharacterized protein LOC132560871 n=1 Tax=Ylistrum balloti TaxID=509963 RepID=UPI002905A222|nr:uncharacterized protein LOC132560871 [Ylistrum balloti]
MSAAPINNPSYRCLLCLKEWNTPRLLPCCHTFCTGCLDTYITSEYIIEDKKSYFCCPVCENTCSPSDEKASVSSWAELFPLHPLVASSVNMGTESKATFCHGCLTDKEENIAYFWCKVCKEALCQQCRVAHRRNKILSNHKIVAIDDVTTIDVRTPVLVNEICPQHTGKKIELYCLDHGALCCVLCITLLHRACKHVSTLGDISKNFSLSPIEDELGKMKTESKTIVNEDESKLACLDANYQTVTKDVATLIKKAKDKLEDLHGVFQTGLDRTYKREKSSLSDRLRINKVFQANVENTKHLLMLIKERRPESEMFIAAEQSKTQILRNARRLQQRTKDKHNTLEMKVTYDDILNQVINNMATVGRLDKSFSLSSPSRDALVSIGTMIDALKKTSSVSESISSSDMLSDPELTTAADVWTGSLSLVKAVDETTIGGSKSSYLTGGVFIEGEGLVVTDVTNKRLLLFNDNYDFVGQYKLNCCPSGITKGFAPHEMLVTLLNAPIFWCTLRAGVLSTVGYIGSPGTAWGIDTIGNNILIGTDDSVQILTKDGAQVASVGKCGKNTFVAVSPQGLFYHRDNDVIVCRSGDGKESFKHMCKGIVDPRGIAIDVHCNVYICGMSSGGVHLMSSDGSKEIVLLSAMCNFAKPYAVILHPKRQEIVVTSCQESVIFEVYKLYVLTKRFYYAVQSGGKIKLHGGTHCVGSAIKRQRTHSGMFCGVGIFSCVHIAVARSIAPLFSLLFFPRSNPLRKKKKLSKPVI